MASVLKIRSFLRKQFYRVRGFQHFFDIPFDTTSPLPNDALPTLQSLCELLKSIDAEFFLRDGTLLGIVRDGRLIPHDSDIDVGVVGLGKSREILSLLKTYGWKLGQSVRFRGQYWHLTFTTETQCIVDITFFRTHQEGLYCFAELDHFFFYPKNLMTGFSSLTLGGFHYPIPEKPEDVLAFTYGDSWRIPRGKKLPWREETYGVALPVVRSVFFTERLVREGKGFL